MGLQLVGAVWSVWGSSFCTRQQEMRFHATWAVPEAYLDFLINSSQSDSDNGLTLADRWCLRSKAVSSRPQQRERRTISSSAGPGPLYF